VKWPQYHCFFAWPILGLYGHRLDIEFKHRWT
jgi:hypothetical protein